MGRRVSRCYYLVLGPLCNAYVTYVMVYVAPRGKRGWHMWYGILRDLVLYLYKDQFSAVKEQPRTCIRLHHALAVRACDYTKRQHVLRLFTADQAQCLVQAR